MTTSVCVCVCVRETVWQACDYIPLHSDSVYSVWLAVKAAALRYACYMLRRQRIHNFHIWISHNLLYLKTHTFLGLCSLVSLSVCVFIVWFPVVLNTSVSMSFPIFFFLSSMTPTGYLSHLSHIMPLASTHKQTDRHALCKHTRKQAHKDIDSHNCPEAPFSASLILSPVSALYLFFSLLLNNFFFKSTQAKNEQFLLPIGGLKGNRVRSLCLYLCM